MPAKALHEKIEHVVVLMLENRSFDHLFGDFPNANGLVEGNGDYKANVWNSKGPTKSQPGAKFFPERVNVQDVPQMVFNPDHSFRGMTMEIFGQPLRSIKEGIPLPLGPGSVIQTTYPPAMSGFCWYSEGNDDPGDSKNYNLSFYQYLPPGERGRLRVLHTLAENFLLCDSWHCDVPSCTVPNRMFMHAATSCGHNSTDQNYREYPYYKAKTIYQQIDETGKDWAMYYFSNEGTGLPSDQTDASMNGYTAIRPQGNKNIQNFVTDAADGNLPFYTFLMCSFLDQFPTEGSLGNSMHSESDVRFGENYVAAVYNALRKSPLWGKTLLIVNFDESGGIYDHVKPPQVPRPDGYVNDGEPSFDFSMLGPRIPAILISPWLDKGIVFRDQLQNTSILRFVQNLLTSGLEPNFLSLTERDAQAPSFASVFWRDEPRTDCLPFLEDYGPLFNTIPFPAGVLSTEAVERYLDAPPSKLYLDVALEYANVLPGHTDSGHRISRQFLTRRALFSYSQERRDAALKFYCQTK